jgi:Tat protein translocase TatB subunit
MGGNLFGIGLGELIFLAILALIVFGPKRIPELARTVGSLIRQLREATSGIEQEVQQWMRDIDHPEEWLEGLGGERPAAMPGSGPGLPPTLERGRMPGSWLGAKPEGSPQPESGPVSEISPSPQAGDKPEAKDSDTLLG